MGVVKNQRSYNFPHQNLSENFIGVAKYKRSEDYSSSKLSEILKMQLRDWDVISISYICQLSKQ